MSEPKKPLSDTQSKPVPLHQSGSHPIARPLNQSGSHPIARPLNQSGSHPIARPSDQSGSHPIARPLNQSGSHPIARPSPGTLTNISKPIKVGTGQSWANLMKSDVDEYARSQAAATAAAPSGPGLIEKLKRLFGKRTKSA